MCICGKYSERQKLDTYHNIFHFQILISLFSSSTLVWLHNGVVVASRSTCPRIFTHSLWNVNSDDEGVYTCRMELSNGTTVERNLSQPLNIVGVYISSDIATMLPCHFNFLCMYLHMDPAILEAIENCMAIIQACIKVCMQHLLRYGGMDLVSTA